MIKKSQKFECLGCILGIIRYNGHSMNVLIPNAASPKNIGDLAILIGLLTVLPKNFNVSIHAHDPYFLSKEIGRTNISKTLYKWAVFEKKDVYSRAKRTTLLLLSILLKARFPSQSTLNKILKDYDNADILLFTGGGYLRSQKGITQSLNLLMLLLMFYYATTCKAKKIIAPISFGPFAYKWQERLAAFVIKNFDIIMVREKYSHKILKKYGIQNVLLSADTSLLLKYPKKKYTNNKLILGFTIRKWLENEKQKTFEDNFAKAIIRFSQQTKAIVQPIVQVDAPEYGDIDLEITQNIVNTLNQNHISTNKITFVTNLSKTNIYSKSDLLLGVRMHSNILAALQGTPFVAISYEYKTTGISDFIGVKNYCIDINRANAKLLNKKLLLLEKNRDQVSQELLHSLKTIRIQEMKVWRNIFLGKYYFNLK